MKRLAIATVIALAICFAIIVGLYIYLGVGIRIGANWSSLDEDGPQWPITVMFLAIYASALSILVLAVALVVHSIRGRPARD